MTADQVVAPLTYGRYLRVPELLDLQTPLTVPASPDEHLFIIGQQAQELWFKQILLDLHGVIDEVERGAFAMAIRLLDRVNRILRLLGDETEVLESLAPIEFQRFRSMLRAASGLESVQFRELELASGLRDEPYLRMVAKLVDLPAILARWRVTMGDALRLAVRSVDPDPVTALIAIYGQPAEHAQLYLLAEGFSEYELRFQEWRFRHMQVVERVIGNRSAGTAGSAGTAYLLRTIGFRFFPELWEARNALSNRGMSAGR